jgi:TPR repeat protein
MNITELREKAEHGSVVAQTALGICYLDGVDAEVDYEEAFRLLSAASEKGASRAIANLARMYADGLGTPKNLGEAIRLFELAANKGEFLAQIELARMFSKGTVVLPDAQAAGRWYSSAIAQESTVGDCVELREARAYIRSATNY